MSNKVRVKVPTERSEVLTSTANNYYLAMVSLTNAEVYMNQLTIDESLPGDYRYKNFRPVFDKVKAARVALTTTLPTGSYDEVYKNITAADNLRFDSIRMLMTKMTQQQQDYV